MLLELTGFATVLAALAAAIGVFVSWRGISAQNTQARSSREDFKLSLAADLSIKLGDRFNSPEQRLIRTRAARALISNEKLIEAEEVFDFFETVGLMIRSGALTRDLAYNFFFHWINMYWVAGQSYIQEERKLSRALWENFEFAYSAVREIEIAKDPNSGDLSLSENPERLKELLQAEIEETD
jgi:hypothetical protein